MPNIQYQITLTSEAANSGPYYVVTYTTGAYYVPVLSGSPAYLPNVGDQAMVEIPSASYTFLAFNLNNNGDGGVCAYCDNDVAIIITGSEPTFTCCTGSILTTAQVGGNLRVTYNSGTGPECLTCNYVTLQTSSNGFDWGGDKTGSCGVSQSIDLTLPTASCPANTTYYRLFQTCTGSIVPPIPTTTTTSTTTTTTTEPTTTTTTSTTTTTTTAPPTTTTTTTTTTSTTTTTTTVSSSCACYLFLNETGTGGDINYYLCGSSEGTVEQLGAGQSVRYCIDTSYTPVVDPGITAVPCTSATTCTVSSECTSCT